MKQYKIMDDKFTITDIAGYDDNALCVAQHELETLKKVFANCRIVVREVSEWSDLQ